MANCFYICDKNKLDISTSSYQYQIVSIVSRVSSPPFSYAL